MRKKGKSEKRKLKRGHSCSLVVLGRCLLGGVGFERWEVMGLVGVSWWKREVDGVGEGRERRLGGAGMWKGSGRLLEGPDLCLFILI